MRKILLLGLLFAATSIPSFAGVRFGGVAVGVGVGFGSAPWYPAVEGYFAPWGFGYPYYWPSIYYNPDADRGAVKLKNVDKTAEVYINQAFAGTFGKLKTFYLDPGAYDVEVRADGHEPQQKRIYVLSGKTVELEF
jgi:PEGA domain